MRSDPLDHEDSDTDRSHFLYQILPRFVVPSYGHLKHAASQPPAILSLEPSCDL